MKNLSLLLFLAVLGSPLFSTAEIGKSGQFPIAEPGTQLIYVVDYPSSIPASVVNTINLIAGNTETDKDKNNQWLTLEGVKQNKETFKIHLLCTGYPSGDLKIAKTQIARYLLEEGDTEPVEFLHQNTGEAILPGTGAWPYLIPGTFGQVNPFSVPAEKLIYLGLSYQLKEKRQETVSGFPARPHLIRLNPDLLAGVPHHTRQKEETRRYDESDYEYIPLKQEDYAEMIAAGLNCFRVDTSQLKWIERSNVYYWGVGGKDIVYPEFLYRSNYIGPVLFFDEPMVRTRDAVVKPNLKKTPALRKILTVENVLEEFKKLYHETKYEEGPTVLIKGLTMREDIDTGGMIFLQENLYTWETMVSSAFYQLTEGGSGPPYAMVFEPPGRFGTRRVLPELNMTFACQIPVDDPKNLAGLVFGFLRGSARVSGKSWGTSIYGAVDRADSFWLLTHAYDLGASLFFYWDSYQLACVPYNEYLTLTRHLQTHARQNPRRDLNILSKAAEIAILLPPGYNLGHVYMGRGVFWGIPELHLDRLNPKGISYRQVMDNFYTEVERCIRLGISYDAFWHLDKINLEGYREVVDIREDGKVEIRQENSTNLLDKARTPQRPDGVAPKLAVEIEMGERNVLTARATVNEGSAPVFYTQGADKNGVYRNIYVLWELYGPEEEDYYYPWSESWNVKVVEDENQARVEIILPVDKPGMYRLRAATSDLAGRSTVVWKEVEIGIRD